jgi:outer membrane protein TolC
MEERHREGLATTLELTESQNTLTRVSLRHAQARQGVALAARELELTAGTLALPATEN